MQHPAPAPAAAAPPPPSAAIINIAIFCGTNATITDILAIVVVSMATGTRFCCIAARRIPQMPVCVFWDPCLRTVSRCEELAVWPFMRALPGRIGLRPGGLLLFTYMSYLGYILKGHCWRRPTLSGTSSSASREQDESGGYLSSGVQHATGTGDRWWL